MKKNQTQKQFKVGKESKVLLGGDLAISLYKQSIFDERFRQESDQIGSLLQIWSHLLKKYLMESLIMSN